MPSLVKINRLDSILVETIIFFLPGKGIPRDSKVLLPIMIGQPIVVALKFFKSSGRCQSN